MQDEKYISFVARHYRKGSFSADKAWSALAIPSASKWRRLRVAAAVAVVVVLSATAAVIYNHYEHTAALPETEDALIQAPQSETVRVIDFEDANLPVVVAKIREMYNVEIYNLPDDAEDYRLSLHYEGTADDLVMTINYLLGTELKIRQ